MRQVPESIGAKVMTAASLFIERGFDGAKMNEISAVTGIPRATLYYHFEGKEAVFSYMCAVIFDAFEEAVSQEFNGPGTAAERLSRVIRAQLGLYASYPIALQALYFDLGRAAQGRELSDRATRAYLRPLVRLLEDGVADGSLRKIERPGVVATAILGSMTIQTLSAIDKESIADLHEQMTSFILRGLQSQPEPVA